MEKFLILAALLVGFVCLLDTVKSFPVDISSIDEGISNPLWLTNYFLTGLGFFLVIITIIFGCVCCKNGKGFKEFSNSSGNLAAPRLDGFVNPTLNSELTIFPPLGANSNEICQFEPLPDIKYQAQSLRPAAFSSTEQEISSQDWFCGSYSNFPRGQLKYVQEYGRGWFGRVVEGEAQNITPEEKVTKVMVKILHEDATPTDHMYFLHEVKFYRDLKHPNILCLLGQCLEMEPFLIILECYPNGDLKSFLSQNLASAQALVDQGITLKMCANITSGLQFMHEKKFIHTDLAARNCLVGPDLTVKIGDYGNSIEIFRTDYYCAGSVALPIRWCAPETLKCTDITIETREVTPMANIWSLGVVFWEISEFCKLPYAELNDDQVIVHVLGEKNYFLEKPNMFCLHKDELYHLMKLCWKPTLQRPSASQICVILDNLISSSKVNPNEIQGESVRLSQDFEQRWQNLKSNSIPRKDDAVEVSPDISVDCSIISLKLKNARVVDSSFVDSPLGVFLTNKNFDKDSPRFCLKSEKEVIHKFNMKFSQEGSGDIEEGNKSEINTQCDAPGDMKEDSTGKVEFDCSTEFQLINPYEKFKEKEPEVDSWLKGMEINNEEDESFVRKISEAIRDLDATLALEKTSSSEDNSGKSTRQNSPEKDVKEINEVTVDFKLGEDTSSFRNFTQKTFELSSLQNSEQPQSLNFTDAYGDKSKEFGENYSSLNLIMPFININKCKNDLDESIKENDSLLCGQSRNSSDTDDEIWRRRIEKGEISEKVKEKSKSIANLMILTHIDSDDSDTDFEKPSDKWPHRGSCIRRSASFAKCSLSSNNFGSENDLTYAVLEEEFRESLKKLSNDHKERGHFDSLGVILPLSTNRENIWENLLKSSEVSDGTAEIETDLNKARKESKTEAEKFSVKMLPEEEYKQNTHSGNYFLGNAASEKLDNLAKDKNSASSPEQFDKYLPNGTTLEGFDENVLVDVYSKCVSKTCKTNTNDPSQNSSHFKESCIDSDTSENSISSKSSSLSNETNGFVSESLKGRVGESFVGNSLEGNVLFGDSQNNEGENLVPSANSSSVCLMFKDRPLAQQSSKDIASLNLNSAYDETVSKNWARERDFNSIEEAFGCKVFDNTSIPEIKITEGSGERVLENEEIFPVEVPSAGSLKFVLNAIKIPTFFETNKTKAANPDLKPGTFDKKLFQENPEDEFDCQENNTVIVGPCEDFTMDYFKGLKTTSEDINMDNENVGQIIKDFHNGEENLDVWDKHLEKVFTQQLSLTNFDDISFRNLSSYSTEDQKPKQNNFVNEICSIESSTDFIESERAHTEKVEELIHLNRLTNLSVMVSEEEYEHFKLRTPDDERSSDSGFRDKGSLSESVEDACEGKYNLEDIEAELEEAFVKGVFANCEVDKEKVSSTNSKDCNNFEYEESKFYEDGNKNEEDFSDIDGEIEFWQNKDESDYYPEISEFNPTCSQGWYLHPPDENMLTYDRNINEDIVNALRNELQENLPVQGRSFVEFNDLYEAEIVNANRDLNVHHTTEFSLPLSPILEEQDSPNNKLKKNIKNSLLEGNNTTRVKKNMAKLIESAKTMDTNTFMQYLDYMIENEGKDLSETVGIEEDIVESKGDDVNSLVLVLDAQNDTFEECDTKSLAISTLGINENLSDDDTQNEEDVSLEKCLGSDNSLEFSEYKIKEDILVVNLNTNEANLFENGKSESLNTFGFVEDKRDGILSMMIDKSENDDLVFTPEMISPDRETSSSEISRSSHGTRTGDALSEITLSSPDLVPDCFSTFIQEASPQSEPVEIPKEPMGNGMLPKDDPVGSAGTLQSSENGRTEFFKALAAETCSVEDIRNDKFPLLENTFHSERKDLELPKGISETSYNLETTIDSNDLYEMSTSFMGDDDEQDTTSTSGKLKHKQTSKELEPRRNLVQSNDAVDWQGESSGAEEDLSSSSEEFIWKLYEEDENNSSAAEVSKNELRISRPEGEIPDAEPHDNDDEDDDDNDNSSSTGSSASFADFVPSAWNSLAIPSRSVLKSPDNKADKQKKNVWFKKQKYHCIYEYPREPSDNEDAEDSVYKQSSYGKGVSEVPIKHFNYGVNTVEFPNKHFPYGISKVIDFSTYTDWDIGEGEDLDLSLTDTDSDNGSAKSDANATKKVDYSFYNLSPFDYDFNTTDLVEPESEFFVSSSSRPFQRGSFSNFWPKLNAENKPIRKDFVNSRDFVTPDSGIEDSANVTPSDKLDLTHEKIYLKMKNFTYPNSGIMNILDNLNFSFASDAKEKGKGIDFESLESNIESKNGFWSSDTSVPLPDDKGLGTLRHARGGLKLDLPRSHNAELGTIINVRKE